MTKDGANLRTIIRSSHGKAYLEFGGERYGPGPFQLVGDAEDFVDYVANLSGLDPYHQSRARLAELFQEWKGR